MAIKVNGKWIGESPEEQLKFEKLKFRNKIQNKKNHLVQKKNKKVFLVTNEVQKKFYFEE
jgi:hypothetical protein